MAERRQSVVERGASSNVLAAACLLALAVVRPEDPAFALGDRPERYHL